ncbi:hypothetical protein TNCV_4953711, partial [Trichonephila clavipes]
YTRAFSDGPPRTMAGDRGWHLSSSPNYHHTNGDASQLDRCNAMLPATRFCGARGRAVTGKPQRSITITNFRQTK